MISKERLLEVVKKVTELSEDNEEVMTLLSEITTDFTVPEINTDDVKDKDGTLWKDKYKAMREKYVERFFSGEPETKDEPVIDDLNSGEDVTFDELFE